MKENEDRIYNDLMYTQNAYFSGEQIFPNWEHIYALVISGFLITYFTATNLGCPEKLILSVIGLLLSFNWFCLVSRNYLYSQVRAERLKELEKVMQDEISKRTALKLFNLVECQEEFINRQKKPWNKIGTWRIRKFLPMFLLIIWLVLMIYTIVC